MERSETHTKRLETSKATSHSDSNESIRVPHKKRVSTGVIHHCKYQGKNAPKHHGIQRCDALCKNAGMLDQNFMAHSSGNKIGKRYDQQSIKDEMRVALGNRSDAVKQYKILNTNGRSI